MLGFWAPKAVDPSNVAVLLNKLREFVLQCDNVSSFKPDRYIEATKSYKTDTLGSDAWGPKELSQLPSLVLDPIPDANSSALNKCVVHHQQLLNLNTVLGKPKGVRTVCKTPVNYRMWARADEHVMDWEKTICWEV